MDAWQSPVRAEPAAGADHRSRRRASFLRCRRRAEAAAPRPQAAAKGRRSADGGVARCRTIYTRCITGNQGTAAASVRHDSESQIVQTPGYVVILTQSNNDVRIIPLDGRPHAANRSVRGWVTPVAAGKAIRSSSRRPISTPTGTGGARPGDMHLIERFTRVDRKTHQLPVHGDGSGTRGRSPGRSRSPGRRSIRRSSSSPATNRTTA